MLSNVFIAGRVTGKIIVCIALAVRDLTSVSAPSFIVANGLAAVHGIFGCLCCALVCVIIQGKANKPLRLGVYIFTVIIWVSAVGYSLFPLSESGYAGSLQDFMHVYVVTALVVVFSISSLTLIAAVGFRMKTFKSLAVFASIALGFMLAGAIGVNAVPLDCFGIFERFSVYSTVIFNAVLGLYGFAFLDNVEDNQDNSQRKP